MSDVTVTFTRDELQELLSPSTAIFDPSRWRERRSVHDKLMAADSHLAHRLLGGSFTDDRGRIQDLIEGPIDAVTRIATVAGAVRGNHFHRYTTQWTYLLTGRLLVSHNGYERAVKAGEMFVDEPGAAHAWKAVEDTDCLVFTQGPRSGENYETDTVRLEKPLLS
jgi:quercetin dioxygenase-like cupin family protein